MTENSHHDTKVAEDHSSKTWMGIVGPFQSGWKQKICTFNHTVTCSGEQLGWKNSSVGRNGFIKNTSSVWGVLFRLGSLWHFCCTSGISLPSFFHCQALVIFSVLISLVATHYLLRKARSFCVNPGFPGDTYWARCGGPRLQSQHLAGRGRGIASQRPSLVTSQALGQPGQHDKTLFEHNSKAKQTTRLGTSGRLELSGERVCWSPNAVPDFVFAPSPAFFSPGAVLCRRTGHTCALTHLPLRQAL